MFVSLEYIEPKHSLHLFTSRCAPLQNSILVSEPIMADSSTSKAKTENPKEVPTGETSKKDVVVPSQNYPKVHVEVDKDRYPVRFKDM